MIIEEKIGAYKALRREIEELEKKKKILSAAILSVMPKEVNTLSIAGHIIKRLSRLSIQIPLEKARALGAIKIEESVDKEKIKDLVAKGHSILGVTEIKYIQVYSPKEGVANDV